MASKAFTFEDIIRDAVKKELSKGGGGDSGGGDFMKMLGIKDLNDITKFIQSLQGLMASRQPATMPAKAPQNAIQTGNAEQPRQTMAIQPEVVFNGLLSVFDGLMTVGGDMKLSEAKKFLLDNKNDVLALIQGQLSAVNNA